MKQGRHARTRAAESKLLSGVGRITGLAAVGDTAVALAVLLLYAGSAVAAPVREVFSDMEHFRDHADEYRELRDGSVLVLGRMSGCGRASGVDVAQMARHSARVFEIHDGKVTKLVYYWDRDRALADLGLEG